MKAFGLILVIAVCLGSLATFSGQDKQPVKTGQSETDLQAVVQGNNEFAFDLYHQLGQKPGNKFFSPYSISTALAMTFAGARGNTAKEMAQTLHFTLDNERLHPAFGELIRKVQGADKKRNYELAVANSLWGDKIRSFPRSQVPARSRKPTTRPISSSSISQAMPRGHAGPSTAGSRSKTNNKIEDPYSARIYHGSTLAWSWSTPFTSRRTWSVPFPKERPSRRLHHPRQSRCQGADDEPHIRAPLHGKRRLPAGRVHVQGQ